MESITQRIDAYPAFLSPLQEAARRYLKHPSVLSSNGVMSIGHRPWIAKQNYLLTLYPGANLNALIAYTRRFALLVPAMALYTSRILRELNGAFCFGMSLFGVPSSMLGDPPLLDRTTLQCHDLAMAATQWVREYRVPPGFFHFASRHWSAKENVGYFIDGGKRIEDGELRIVCAKKSGEVVGEWADFTSFLRDELPASEKLEEELHPSR